MVEASIIEGRDYTLIVDKSGSMNTSDVSGCSTRWEAAQASTLALAQACEKFDPDGITVYLFSGRFRRYDNVTSAKVAQIYELNEPMGRTDLAGVLADAFDNYFQRKADGLAKEKGETFLIITDGEPTDRKSVMRLIIEVSKQVESAEELVISLIQVGRDRRARDYLKALDDQLQDAGARYDIVTTFPIDEIVGRDLSEVLLATIRQKAVTNS